MKRLLFLCVSLIITLSSVFGQTREIRGVVKEAGSGNPLSFVNVGVKGTTTAATTLDDGSYIIKASSDATLLFSFIGYKTIEVPINSRDIINVELEADAFILDEVVMVAYGTAKRESITGAISTVNSRAIEKRPVSSVSAVLEGQATGVQVNNSYGEPGANPEIRIRGFGSVNGSNDPLFVVDGVPYSGNMTDLNPNDIESISILKDAASSALFGNRASNGVIIITTKRGKSEKTNLRASINQGVYTRGMKEYEKLNPKEYMEVMWLGLRNNLLSKHPTTYPTVESANAEATRTLIPTYLKYNIFNKSNEELFDANGKVVADARILSGYDDLDWFKNFERLGYRQDYNISGDAASEKSSYFFSLGYLDEKGYIKSSDYTRFTGRTTVTVNPKRWISAGFTLSGSHQISNNSSGSASSNQSFVNPFNYARNIAPIFPVYLHDMATGEYLLDENGNKQYDNGVLYSRSQYLDRHVIWENELDMDRTFRNTLAAQAFMDIKFLNDFKFVVKGDINLRNLERQTYNNATIGDGAGNKGRASRIWNRYKNYTFQQQLIWDKSFDFHNVDILLGHENYSWNRAYHNGYKTTETFEGGKELINFTDITRLTGYQQDYTLESFLARARYNFDNKYFAEASFRRDGSSRFHPDHRWGNFWSLGGSWTITKEPFMAPYLNSINSLKMRASYGQVGNDAGVDYYGYMALYSMAQNANRGALYKIQNDAKNIKWETSASFGVALEASLFNRLNLSVEYFDKRSNDLLFDVNLPLSAGGTKTDAAEATITQNIGSVSNRGVELSVDADIIRKRDFKWNVGFNATLLKNKIVRLPEQNRENGIITGFNRYFEGRGIYDFWMFQYVGVDKMSGRSLYLPDTDRFYFNAEEPEEGKNLIPAQYLVQIGDDYYTNFTTYASKGYSGSAIPDLYGSFTTSISYKSFDLSMLFTYSIGGKTYDNSYRNLMSVTANPGAQHRDVLKAWNGIPQGWDLDDKTRIDRKGVPIVDYELSSFNDAISSRFLIDASYFTVKNISLSYTLPKRIAKKLDISDMSVNMTVDNLATFTKLTGMNPQQSFDGTNYNAFVAARVFSVGLNIRL